MHIMRNESTPDHKKDPPSHFRTTRLLINPFQSDTDTLPYVIPDHHFGS